VGEDPHAVVLGIFLVNTLPTRILFDASATHSFINPATARRLACRLDELDVQPCVTTRVGFVYQAELVVKNFPIIIHDRMFTADLVLLEIQGYNVILGMDWLTKYKAAIDCEQKIFTDAWRTLEGYPQVIQGQANPKQRALTAKCKHYAPS